MPLSSRRLWQSPPPPSMPSRLAGQPVYARTDTQQRLLQFEMLGMGPQVRLVRTRLSHEEKGMWLGWWQAAIGVPFLISLPFQGILVTSSSSNTYLLAFLEMDMYLLRSAWSLLKNCDHITARSFSERLSYRMTTWTRETKASSK